MVGSSSLQLCHRICLLLEARVGGTFFSGVCTPLGALISTSYQISQPSSPYIKTNAMKFFELFILAFIAPTIAIGTCYNPGPSFPPVDHILTQVHFNILSLKLHSLVDDFLSRPDGWATNTTSFAIQLTSSNETIWSRYYTAPKLGNYTDSKPTPVTGDTNFRVASISKTFTVYALLLEKRISLEDPVTKYLPELLEGEKPVDPFGLLVQWDQITIRALASQLSGISRESVLIAPLLNKSYVLTQRSGSSGSCCGGFKSVGRSHRSWISSNRGRMGSPIS